MGNTSKPLQVIVWGAMGLTMVAIVVAFILKERKSTVTSLDGVELKDIGGGAGGPPPVLFDVSDFALTNQTGAVVTRSNLLGKVWLADIIFTRCAGPCPEMTRRMAELHGAIPPQSPVAFVTLTTDPLFDTPQVMLSYARRHGAQPGRWHFLTGTPRQIADFAVQGLKLTALDKEASKQVDPNDLFIHSTIFVVVDKRGRARAVLESDDPALKVKALGLIQQLIDER